MSRTSLQRGAWLVAALVSCGQAPVLRSDAGPEPVDVGVFGADAQAPGWDAGAEEPDAAGPLDAGGEVDAAALHQDASALADAGDPADAAGDASQPPDAAGGDAGAGEDAAAPSPDASAPDAGPRCDPPCEPGQTCLETTCAAVRYDALCALGKATQIVSGNHADDVVAASVAATLGTHCGAGFALTARNLSDPGVFAGGRLSTPRGELVITTGGFFFNPLVSALETTRVSPLFFTSTATTVGWTASATGQPVFSTASTAVSAERDFFVVELFPDGDGRLLLVLYGVGVEGTLAAGRQAQTMLDNPAAYPEQWFVYEWSAAGDAGTEERRLVAAGSE